ncbi:alpha/beta hydrolase family protein [Sphingomonas floccifaciens]|uniref:Alpha/beta hydrolase family protein n=1 Tax=Sphingomonas floccifaciens TaxID=1844115 RepID=A0ABW4N7Y7_9SPHN
MRRMSLFVLAIAAGSLTVGSTAQTPPAKPTGPRPIEHFAELPALVGPKLSPDGKRIAAQVAIKGKQYFAILSVEGQTPPRLIGTGKGDLNWWRWVNDDWLVVGIGDKVPVANVGEWYIRRAVGVGASDGKIVPLVARNAAQTADDVIWTARDGTPRALIAYQTSIYSNDPNFWPQVDEVDVSTGKTKRVVGPREGVMTWVADGRGVVRMGIGSSLDGRQRRVLYRHDAGQDFTTIVKARTHKDNYVVPASFLADPTKALAMADDADGFGGLYEYDLTKLELGKRLYGSKGFDLGGYVLNDARDGLTGITYDDDTSRTEWIDPDMVALQAEVQGFVKNGRVAILNYSRDHSRAIVDVGATNSPGAFYLYDRPTKDMRLLAYGNAAIRSARLNPIRTIRYKARDGLEIAAILTLPKGKSNNLPLIVLPHGGPFARDAEEWDWWTQFLAERGYAVVQPNYRGSSGYGTQFTVKGQGQWGLAMQDDLNDAVAQLAKDGIADPKRVCIVGASYGGYAAMRAAQRDPGVYRCAVSYAGVSDLPRLRRYDSQFLNSGARSDWLKLQAADFKAVSPIFSPEKTAIPLLLVHGKADTVVPIAQSREMAERLREAGKDVTYIEQPLGDHHFTRGEDRLEFLRALQAFLDKHNPA